MADSVIAPIRPAFRLLARIICPDARALGDADWVEVERLVDGALATRPLAVQRQFRLFVRAMLWAPLPFYGRPLGMLSASAQARFLHRVEHGPIARLRQGLWGLRTLVFLGVYARPGAREAAGWRGDPRGWDARRPEDRFARISPSQGTPLGLVK
jgi:hypothetical protein